MPQAVHSRGVVEGNAVVHLATQYLYDQSGLTATAISGSLSQSGRPFTHGFEFYLERATLAFEFANLGGQGHVATPLSVILPDGTVAQPALGSGDPIDAFAAELTQAVEAVATGKDAPGLADDLARTALKICHAEVESVKTPAGPSGWTEPKATGGKGFAQDRCKDRPMPSYGDRPGRQDVRLSCAGSGGDW